MAIGGGAGMVTVPGNLVKKNCKVQISSYILFLTTCVDPQNFVPELRVIESKLHRMQTELCHVQNSHNLHERLQKQPFQPPGPWPSLL